MRSRPTALVNALFVQAFDGFSLTVEGLNLTGSRADDIAYAYASRLPGEPDQGVADIHFHPVEPRAFRIGLKLDL